MCDNANHNVRLGAIMAVGVAGGLCIFEVIKRGYKNILTWNKERKEASPEAIALLEKMLENNRQSSNDKV